MRMEISMDKVRYLLLLLLLVVVQMVCLFIDDAAAGTYNNRAPRILSQKRDVLAMVGGTGFMECRAKGRPKPNRHWLKDGRPIEKFSERFAVNKKTKSLRIFHARLEDSGNYTCLAKNKHGVDRMTYTMEVMKKPDITILPSNPLHVHEGTRLDIVCRSVAWPKPSYSWVTSRDVRLGSRPIKSTDVGDDEDMSRFSLQDRVLKPTVSESVLSISRVSHRDYGLFVCFSGNKGASTRAEIMVDVQFSPKPLPDQKQVRETVYYYQTEYRPPFILSCAATGNELPEIQWFYNDVSLNTSHCQVVRNPPEIRSFACTVNENTLGNYKCYARNQYGKSLIKEFDVQPLYAPPKVEVFVGTEHANTVRVTAPLGKPNTPDPDYVVVSYRRLVNGKPSTRQRDLYETTANLDSGGEATVVLPGLKEHASYLVSVASKNEVGLGPEAEVTIETGRSVSLYDDLVHLVDISGNGQVIDYTSQEAPVISDPYYEPSLPGDVGTGRHGTGGGAGGAHGARHTNKAMTDSDNDDGDDDDSLNIDDEGILQEGIAHSVRGRTGRNASPETRISNFDVVVLLSGLISLVGYRAFDMALT